MRVLNKLLTATMAMAVAAAWLTSKAWAEDLFPTTMAPNFNNLTWLNNLEPASGAIKNASDSESASSSTDTPEVSLEKAPTANHNEDHDETPSESHAKGHSEQTSDDKNIPNKLPGSPAPPLPQVKIGGRVIEPYTNVMARLNSITTPASLQNPMYQAMLAKRINLTPYAHNPRQGDDLSITLLLNPESAPKIQVIEITDLACTSCLAELAKIEPVLKDFSSSIVRIHVHVPAEARQDTNLPAFYGKVAARSGNFWEYRQTLMAAAEVNPETALKALLSSNLKERTMRQLMLTEARRFYRELDADTTLARHFAISQPPILLVNGIQIGKNGLPFSLLRDVMIYVQSRHQLGLETAP